MLSSDQQFPYQDDKAIDLWFKVMKWFKPDVVDYLGDTDDQACYSRFTKGTSAEFITKHFKDFDKFKKEFETILFLFKKHID